MAHGVFTAQELKHLQCRLGLQHATSDLATIDTKCGSSSAGRPEMASRNKNFFAQFRTVSEVISTRLDC